MTHRTTGVRSGRPWKAACAALLTLAASCAPFATKTPDVTPRARPAALAQPESVTPPEPSQASKDLRAYYTGVQRNLLAQGLLRQDGGGIDTPFSAADLARNFERIAFFHEYERGTGLSNATETPDFMRRWTTGVRIQTEFGTSVPEEIRQADRGEIQNYAARLARVTGHSVTTVPRGGNFHVLVMGEDDREEAVRRIRQLVPSASESTVNIIRTLPRPIHCVVFGFSSEQNDSVYRRAIAYVRAEHPDLMRLSCYHEEIAQGLGLANDSPRARPSIFNDDDEFALLTSQDEMLLRMLYDPRLKPGLTLEEARPIISTIAASLRGGPI